MAKLTPTSVTEQTISSTASFFDKIWRSITDASKYVYHGVTGFFGYMCDCIKSGGYYIYSGTMNLFIETKTISNPYSPIDSK